MTERHILAEHPGLIQWILIIVTGLDKAVVLLEPIAKFRLELDQETGGESLDQIWLTIQRINKDLLFMLEWDEAKSLLLMWHGQC